jgi:hypothetical protein
MYKLKPNTSYDFSEADLQFAMELAKVGFVNLSSSQVTLRSSKGLQFKDYGSDDKCEGLVLPPNWAIESIYHSEESKSVGVLFSVKKALRPAT